jgi:hypothetical protein
MRLICFILSLVVTLSATMAPLSQAESPLERDNRLRILYSPAAGSPTRLDVLYVHWGQDSLFVRSPNGSPYGLSWPDTKEVERFAGQRNRAGAGALIGLTVGLIAGMAVGIEAAHETGMVEFTDGEALLVGAVVTGAVTGLGALIGSQIKQDRWEQVSVDSLRYTANN